MISCTCGGDTKATINENNLILKSNYDTRYIEDCSGNYKIEDIKKIKFSYKYIATPIFIIGNIIYVFLGCISILGIIIEYMKLNFEIIIGIIAIFIMHFILLNLYKVKTIKIKLKNNKNIHIPIKGNEIFWSSKKYKQRVYKFIKEIESNMNKT